MTIMTHLISEMTHKLDKPAQNKKTAHKKNNST